jgi:glucose/arabinose dehydrogenase/soluble lytic murein transglycosylase-like protein
VNARQRRILAAIVIIAVLGVVIVVVRIRKDNDAGTVTPVSGPIPPSSEPTSNPAIGSLAIAVTPIGSVTQGTDVTARPNDSSLYVTEQAGTVRRLRRGGNGAFTLDADPYLDVTSDVTAGGERGLLGIAFSKDGTKLYFAFTNRHADQQVDEVTIDGDHVVQGSRRTLIVVPDFASNHNGGDLILGPDGFLYYTMGDGGGGGDPHHSGQNPHDLLGDVMRIDPTKPSGDKAYGIPSDNPFADGKDGAPEVWVYGLRNPWRMSFDRNTHDLWIADVGQGAIEEVDFLASGTGAGTNFGWSDVEGTHPFSQPGPPAGAVPPIYEYSHDGGGCSITGGFVYRGKAIPALVGTYLFADYCAGELMGLQRATDGTVQVTDLKVQLRGPSSFGEDNDGEVYVITQSDNTVSRIDLAAAPSTTSAAAPPTTDAALRPPPLSSDPTTAADQLAAAEVTLRDPAASPADLAAAAHIQQLAYRRLGTQPELDQMILEHAPAAVRGAVADNLDARHELAAIPGGVVQDTLPAWRIDEPAPEADLRAFYDEGEKQYGVGWNYLAAINLIESAMGRIHGLSSAGAQGPMQFMPATWDHYGDGDIDSPHDAILAAARYLNANGFADGNVDGALFHYNNTEHYVNAVKDIAAVLGADQRALEGYYRWDVYYVTTMGDVHLPVGYETPDRIPVADYLATHPQEA